MVWERETKRWSGVVRTLFVAAAHAILLTWVLSSKITIPITKPVATLWIELVELEPEPSAPPPQSDLAPSSDPRPEQQFERSEGTAALAQQPSLKPNTIVPQAETTARSSPLPYEQPPILMQKDRATSTEDAVRPQGPTTSDADGVTASQLAGLVRQLECQKLAHRIDEDCPTTDAFTAWASNAERATVERNMEGDRSYRSKSVIDRFYEREVRNRLHWPDEDLFADPMPPGAYNAQRIRRGQEPLWSKELRDGFRKPNE